MIPTVNISPEVKRVIPWFKISVKYRKKINIVINIRPALPVFFKSK